ncbi:hypothetical protein AVEN_60290-1 [Araneus ventricosus]|uniref:Uncharacterized protein n=1 Tax=Araneus ventricosus TaxID=182803 RepID=A0A4Y2D285_ARAVE|nr:hypothetical protein AVEN_60290-1 [Araneus ventricosus]
MFDEKCGRHGESSVCSLFIETKSNAQVKWKFGTQYGREPPSRPIIRAWLCNLWKQVVFAINRGRVTHLFQTLTLHLGIGLCLDEPGYTLNFLLWRPHLSSNLHLLESKTKTL